MSVTRDEAKRLAFSKYLLSLGRRHMKLHEPLASVSLLLFHDATEHLLALVAEHVGAKECKEFMEYWKLIHEKRPSYELPDRVAMDRFNRARVTLKHRGLQHSRAQLEEFQNSVFGFFGKVLLDVFQTSLDAISLTEFVTNKDARDNLKKAEEALAKGNVSEVAALSALALDDLLRSSRFPKSMHSRYDILSLPRELANVPCIYQPDDRGENREASDFLRAVKEAIQALRETVHILSLGIDAGRYARFYSLTPEVTTPTGDRRKTYDRVRRWSPELAPDDAEFCIEFVIDAAFQLQDRAFTPPTLLPSTV